MIGIASARRTGAAVLRQPIGHEAIDVGSVDVVASPRCPVVASEPLSGSPRVAVCSTCRGRCPNTLPEQVFVSLAKNYAQLPDIGTVMQRNNSAESCLGFTAPNSEQ